MRISVWSSDVCSSDLRDGLEHYAQVLRHRLAADVLEIIVHLGADVLERAIVEMIDLGQPGDPWLGPLPQRILRDLLPQLGEAGRSLGDRKSVVEGKRVSVRVDHGGGRLIKKTK